MQTRKRSLLGETAVLLGLGLLTILVVGQWLNAARRTVRAGADPTIACANNLSRLALAVSAYTQDYDETLPPMQDAAAFKAAVLPYAGDATVFNCPDTGLPYTPNAAISRQTLSALGDDYDVIEVARDSQPHEDGLETVVFLDGTVEHGGQIVGDPNALVVSRAKRLALAVQQYVQDSDEFFPPMHDPQEFQTALYPFTHSRRVFDSPAGQPFVPNAALSGVSLVSIADPAATVLLQDTAPYTGGAPTIAYVDGHVKHNAASLSVPSPVPGGTVVTATVTLGGTAPADTVVGLSSSDSSVVRLHRAVIVPAGSSSASFPITTYPSPATQTVTITATLGTAAQTQPLTITSR